MAAQMTGFQIACELADFGARMVEAAFVRNNPNATDEAVREAVREWWGSRPGAEFGDAPGNVRSIDYLS